MDENPYRAPLTMPVAAFPSAWVRGILATLLRTESLFSLTGWLALGAIIGVLVALLVPAIQAASEASRRSQCSPGLKQPMPPNSLAPASNRAVAPRPDRNVRGIAREALSRVFKVVRKKTGGMLWSVNWLAQQPMWFLVLVYVVAVGRLAALGERRCTANRARIE